MHACTLFTVHACNQCGRPLGEITYDNLLVKDSVVNEATSETGVECALVSDEQKAMQLQLERSQLLSELYECIASCHLGKERTDYTGVVNDLWCRMCATSYAMQIVTTDIPFLTCYRYSLFKSEMNNVLRTIQCITT